MKRKGLLKKMITVLCIGVLISMPITVSAAEKEDVVGEWDGGWQVFTFYENGDARHQAQFGSFQIDNTRPYTMESGSITVENNSGDMETLNYDLWRGEQIKDVPYDQYADAVVYKIIEPGKMQSWNVSKKENSNVWTSYEPSLLTKVTESKKADADSGKGSDYKCEHNYEWSITTEPTETTDGVSSYRCTSCGDVKEKQPISAYVVIRNNILAAIKNAKAGTTVTFDNKAWLCYPQYVLDALKEKGDVSLKTDFTYKGINYSFTIPAGSDYTNLEKADFYGFMYLYGAFNGTIVE